MTTIPFERHLMSKLFTWMMKGRITAKQAVDMFGAYNKDGLPAFERFCETNTKALVLVTKRLGKKISADEFATTLRACAVTPEEVMELNMLIENTEKTVAKGGYDSDDD